MSRFSRHSGIPGWNQERLAASTVVVIGVGALGTEVARMLAQSGVGHLILCDGDRVSESNLSRGAIFRPSDVGRSKVEVAAEELSELHPGLSVDIRRLWLSCGVGLAELRDAHAVVSCLDSRTARVELAQRCNLVEATMLDGGTRPWGGEVRVYKPGKACFGCGLTDAERAETDDPVRCGVQPSTAPAPASAPISALVGAMLAATVLRTVLDLPVRPGGVSLDASSGESRRVTLTPNPRCPLHARIPADALERSHHSVDTTPDRLISLLKPDEHLLTWSHFPTPGDTWTRSIQLRDAPQEVRLRELGVAPREILTVVRPGRPDRYIELARGGHR